MPRWPIILSALFIFAAAVPADEAKKPLPYDRKQDVIYGRKFGLCMTMDVFTPREHRNGAGVIAVISGGWVSRHDEIEGGLAFGNELLKRGYVVFAVVHGSQPKFTVPECIDDLHRSIRFIRHNAKEYGIDPERIGITGASAGCHLSLVMGACGREGDPKAKDPVERESSRVAAVAGFFPPTDFFNYGSEGREAKAFLKVTGFSARFDFREYDRRAKAYKPVSDERYQEIMKEISPAQHVSEKCAPTLLIHGDIDLLVPLQQSKLMVEKLKEKNVPCELIVHKGGGHGWLGIEKDVTKIADWFDKYLAKK